MPQDTTVSTTTRDPLKQIFKCDFEKSFCEWQTDATTNRQWIRQNGLNAAFGSAPLIDHTFQNIFGIYAFVNPNTSVTATQTARLRSPAIDWSTASCLEYWYQLASASTTKFTVNVRNSSSKLELWRRLGGPVDAWKHAYVRIPDLSNQLSIDFEGKQLMSCLVLSCLIIIYCFYITFNLSRILKYIQIICCYR